MEEELKFIDHQDQEKRNRREKTAIKRRYYFIMGGLVSLFGGYVSTVSLQSSIRVQDGLGKFQLNFSKTFFFFYYKKLFFLKFTILFGQESKSQQLRTPP